MNYKLINKVCFRTAIGSIVTGTVISLAAIWLENLIPVELVTKGLATTTLLFVAATLGALATRLLVVKDEPADDPMVAAVKNLSKLTAGEFCAKRDRGEF